MSRVEDPEENPVRASGAVLPPTSSRSRIEAKAREQAEGPPRRSFVAEVVNELSSLTSELDRSNAPFGITGRMAASMGFLALVALLFVILMPSVRQADTPSSFSEEVQQFTAALSRQPRPQPSSADGAAR